MCLPHGSSTLVSTKYAFLTGLCSRDTYVPGLCALASLVDWWFESCIARSQAQLPSYHFPHIREGHLYYYFPLPSGDTNSQSVINHNPLPDIPHEEFVSLMGPLLVPEHYPSPESPLSTPPLSPPPLAPSNGAPFEWIHFEGRSVKTTLSNLQGLDGLARERRWRPQCVFSVDVGRRAKQGIEAVRTELPPCLVQSN